MKLFQKAKFFFGLWQTGKNGCLSHTHTGPNVEAKFEKDEIDSESACSEDSASLFKIKIKGLQVKL
jgi:hypothetical protein